MAKSAKKPKEKKLPNEESTTATASNPIASFSGNPNAATSKSNSNVLSSLFGEIPEKNSTNFSLFSDQNPFRRKPHSPSSQKSTNQNGQMGLGFQIPNSEKGEKVGIFGNSDGSAEQKKGKRKKEKKGENEEENEEEEEEEKEGRKKLKRVESGKGGNKGNLGVGGEENEGNGVNGDPMSINGTGKEGALRGFVEEGNGINEGKEEKKRKKRKRDEVEAEYEAKRYGVVEEGKEEGGGVVVGGKRKNMDSLEDIMVSKEGFDDENKLLRTVFVGNLPLKIKKKVLIREFGKFGEVESVRIRSVPLNDVSVYLVFIFGFWYDV